MLKARARDRIYKRMVGLLVIATALAALYVLHLFVEAKNPFATPLRMHGTLARVDGVKIGTPVVLAGIGIGRVVGFAVTTGNRVRIDLEIEQGHQERVRADSVATLQRPLLGSAFIDISIGSDAQPPFPNDGEIRMSRAPDLSDVVATLPARLEQVDAVLGNLVAVSADLRALSRSLAAPEAPLTATLRNVEQVSAGARQTVAKVNATLDGVAPAVQDARKAIEGVNAVLADVRAGTQQLGTTMTQVRAILDDVQAVTGEVRAAAPDIPGTVEAGKAALQEADDVLRAVKNSFLLRGGAPPPAEDPPLLAPRLP